jgi:anti-sigma B factor antagonist
MNSQNADSAMPLGDTTYSTSPAGGFGVVEKWVERTVVVAATGDLDLTTAPELADAISAAARKEPKALIVDLSQLTFLASAGMSLLIEAHRDMEPKARFGVVADGPCTSRPLKLIGLDSIFDLYPTLDEALAECQ